MVQYASIEVAGPVSFRLSLIAGSSTAECRLAQVMVGMEPKPGPCPVRNVSPGGNGGPVPAAPSTQLLALGGERVADGTTATPAGATAPVTRIVGGRPMPTAGKQALLVRLVNSKGRAYCTGSFYAPHHVVTAAHCPVNLSDIAQVFPPSGNHGAPAVLNMTVATVITHPLYENERTYILYDVSILTLRPPEGTSAAAVAAIPWPRLVLNSGAAVPADGDAVRVAGFGRVVDGGPASDGALFVDQPALTPGEAAEYQRDVEQPRKYPNG
eukprot:contig_33147_g8022